LPSLAQAGQLHPESPKILKTPVGHSTVTDFQTQQFGSSATAVVFAELALLALLALMALQV
jgi:hypothetical protein